MDIAKKAKVLYDAIISTDTFQDGGVVIGPGNKANWDSIINGKAFVFINTDAHQLSAYYVYGGLMGFDLDKVDLDTLATCDDWTQIDVDVLDSAFVIQLAQIDD